MEQADEKRSIKKLHLTLHISRSGVIFFSIPSVKQMNNDFDM